MTPNIYDFIAKMFVNTGDTLRPVLSKPGEQEGLVYATDAHTCIRFDKKLTSIDYSKNKDFPNAKSIFDKLLLDETQTLNVDDLLLQIFHCQAQYETYFETCTKCNGEGEIHCDHCENEANCKRCDGDGGTDEITRYAGITINGDNINFLGKKVQPRFLYKVIQCALLLKQETIEVKYHKERLELIFTFDQVEILVMTMTQQ